MGFKLNVTLWERKPDGDLTSSLKRKFSLPVDADLEISSLKDEVERMFLRATKTQLEVKEFLDGDDCNIEWDTGHVVKDYFTPPAQAGGNDKLYTLKIVRNINAQEEERRRREGTIIGGSFDISRAVARPRSKGQDQTSGLHRGRNPDEALPSYEGDTEPGLVPQTPVSHGRKRRHSSNHAYREPPFNRNSSLQILATKPNIEFGQPEARHPRSSQSPKSESPSEPGTRPDPEVPSVVQVQNSFANSLPNGDINMEDADEVDEVPPTQPPESVGKSVQFSTTPRRQASKEALQRSSKSVTPSRAVWDPSSQDVPTSQPKRPTALSRSGLPGVKASSSNVLVNGTADSEATTVTSVLDEQTPAGPGVVDEQTRRQRNASGEEPTRSATSVSTEQSTENHGDLVTGTVTEQDVENAMNVDIPDLADLIKPPPRPTRAKKTLGVPSTAPRHRSSVTSESSPRPILRKASLASDAGTSNGTTVQSSPSLQRRNVSFSVEPPSVIGTSEEDKTNKGPRTDNVLPGDSASLSSEDEEDDEDESDGEDLAVSGKLSNSNKKSQAAPKHNKGSNQADEMDVDTPKATAGKKSAKTPSKETATETPTPKAVSKPATVRASSSVAKKLSVKEADNEPSTPASMSVKQKGASKGATTGVSDKALVEKRAVTPSRSKTPGATDEYARNFRAQLFAMTMPGSAGSILPPTVAKPAPAAVKAPTAKTPAKGRAKSTPAPSKSASKNNSKSSAATKDATQLDDKAEDKAAQGKAVAKRTPKSKSGNQKSTVQEPAETIEAATSDEKSDAEAEEGAKEPGNSTANVLKEMDQRARSKSADPSANPVLVDSARRGKKTTMNPALRKVQEMRARASSTPDNTSSEDHPATPTESTPAGPKKKGRVPPGSRKPGASVVGRPSSKGSVSDTNAAKSDAQKIASQNDIKKTPTTGRKGSDERKIESLSKSPDKRPNNIEVASDDSTSSDGSDAESEIPGRRESVKPEQPEDTENDSPTDDSSDSASEDESEEEDSEDDTDADTLLNKALKGKAAPSSQSISLTPPTRAGAVETAVSTTSEDADMPDATSAEQTSSAKQVKPTPRASQQEEPDLSQSRWRPSSQPQNRVAKQDREISESEDSDSEEEELPVPRTVVSTIPTQIKKPLVEDDSDSDESIAVPPPRMGPFSNGITTISQPRTSSFSAQRRVTSQLNSETRAAMPSTQEPPTSSAFGTFDTPTPLPGRGDNQRANGVNASKIRAQHATGLSQMLQNKRQTSGQTQSAKSQIDNPMKSHNPFADSADDDDEESSDDDKSSDDSDGEDDGKSSLSARQKQAKRQKSFNNFASWTSSAPPPSSQKTGLKLTREKVQR